MPGLHNYRARTDLQPSPMLQNDQALSHRQSVLALITFSRLTDQPRPEKRCRCWRTMGTVSGSRTRSSV